MDDVNVTGHVASVFTGLLSNWLFHVYLQKRSKIRLSRKYQPILEVLITFAVVLSVSAICRVQLHQGLIIALMSSVIASIINLMRLSNTSKKLQELADILGAVDWSSSTVRGSTATLLEQVIKSFRFMGLGFSKFTGYKAQDDELDFESVVAKCYAIAPSETIQVMIMNPFCDQIAAYEVQHGVNSIPNTPLKIIESLYIIERLREKGYNIEVRFYPVSMKALASFRLFFVDGQALFVSFYKYSNEGYDVPQLQLVDKGDATFYRPFSELYRYLWENGEDANYYRINYRISTDEIRSGPKIDKLVEYIRIITNRYHNSNDIGQSEYCLAAIAGKDSVAAIIKIIQERKYKVIVPVIVHVPTEYGEYNCRIETVKSLRKYSEDNFTKFGSLVTSAIIVEDSGLWGKINSGSKLLDIQDRYGSYSPCVGCHFYIHALRCHLARDLQVKHVVSGDRESHGDIVKINQLPEVLDMFQAFADKQYKVNLEFPIRDIQEDKQITDILHSAPTALWDIQDLACHFGKSGSLKVGSGVATERWISYLNDEVSRQFIGAMSNATKR